MLSRYYPSLGPNSIPDLSVYQFQSYLNNIANMLEKREEGKRKEEDVNKLIAEAKSLGFPVPKKY